MDDGKHVSRLLLSKLEAQKSQPSNESNGEQGGSSPKYIMASSREIFKSLADEFKNDL